MTSEREYSIGAHPQDQEMLKSILEQVDTDWYVGIKPHDTNLPTYEWVAKALTERKKALAVATNPHASIPIQVFHIVEELRRDTNMYSRSRLYSHPASNNTIERSTANPAGRWTRYERWKEAQRASFRPLEQFEETALLNLHGQYGGDHDAMAEKMNFLALTRGWWEGIEGEPRVYNANIVEEKLYKLLERRAKWAAENK